MSNVIEQLKKLLNEVVEIDGKSEQLQEVLLKVLLTKALQGETKALNLILEYIAAKPTQSIELSGKNDSAIEFDSNRAIQAIDERVKGLIGSGENTVSSSSIKD